MKKKLFVLLLSVLCICSLIPTAAFAVEHPEPVTVLYEQNFDNLEDESEPVPVEESNYMKAEGLTVHGGSFCQVMGGRVAINGGRTETFDEGTAATVYGLNLDADQIEISVEFLADPEITVSGQLQLFPYAESNYLDFSSAFLDVQNFDGGFTVLLWTSGSTYDIAGKIPFDGKMHSVGALIDKASGTYSILIDGELSEVTDVDSFLAEMPMEAVGVKVIDFTAATEGESMFVIDNLTVKAYGEIYPVPVETEPVETEPVETEPAETEPAETEPAATEPAETDPAPVESDDKTADTAPTEPAPAGKDGNTTGIIIGVVAAVVVIAAVVVVVLKKKKA